MELQRAAEEEHRDERPGIGMEWNGWGSDRGGKATNRNETELLGGVKTGKAEDWHRGEKRRKSLETKGRAGDLICTGVQGNGYG